MPKGRCRCGAIRYRLKLPVQYRGHCFRSGEQPRTTLLSVPHERFSLKSGIELLEDCGPWQLCARCGTTLFYRSEESVSALPATIEWPAQNVDDLHQQADFGNYLEVRKRIHRGMPLESRLEGSTPLISAIKGFGGLKAAGVLLEHGALMDPAIESAAGSRSRETGQLLRLFLRHGADRQRLFSEAVWRGRVRDARAVYSPDLNLEMTYRGKSLLYLAYLNSVPMIRYLVEKGVTLHHLSEDRNDPLHWAAYYGQHGKLEALLEAAPALEILDDALTGACYGGRLQAAEKLLAAGARVNQTDFTPLMAASRHGSLVLVNFLLELGADPNAKDSEGMTALDHARQFVPDLLATTAAKFRAGHEGRLQHRRTTNKMGEPSLRLRKNGRTRMWTHCHAAIVERLSGV